MDHITYHKLCSKMARPGWRSIYRAATKAGLLGAEEEEEEEEEGRKKALNATWAGLARHSYTACRTYVTVVHLCHNLSYRRLAQCRLSPLTSSRCIRVRDTPFC